MSFRRIVHGLIHDPLYSAVVGLARTAFFLQDLKVHTKGAERLPAAGGAVIAANHTGYLDFVYVGVAARTHQRFIRFMAKSEVFKAPVAGRIMRGLKHISVDRIDGAASYHQAVNFLRNGEFVGIFPEGTISRSYEVKTLRSGAVRMAQEAGVPIYPVTLIGSQRVWPKVGKRNLGRKHIPLEIWVGEPFYPQGDAEEATREFQALMKKQLDEQWDYYIDTYGPFPAGEPWMPRRFGGSAPDPQIIEAEDEALYSERMRVRHLREDLDSITAKMHQLSAEFLLQRGEEFIPDGTDVQEKLKALSTNVQALTGEATAGLKVGVSKVQGAVSRLSESSGQLVAQLGTRTEVLYSPSISHLVDQVLAEAKQVRDRLPGRCKSMLPVNVTGLVSDVDGTIYHDQEISPAIQEAVKLLEASGRRFIMATGRPPSRIPKIINKLNHAPLAVSANGAVVMDTATEEILHVEGFTQEQHERILEVSKRVFPGCEFDIDIVDGTTIKVTVLTPGPSKEICEKLAPELEGVADVTYSWKEGHAELSPIGVTKATGLQWLVEHEGLDPATLVACGDMPNDIEMLDMVGLGVAMGNADPQVIAKAQYVTAPVEKDGVAQVIAAILETDK
ncbi:MAG: HAD-IIB family hydrolase [Corynebacterium sp.]|nr:HAD-IIB family hydrolase [Corynebacterium sp.]